MSNTEHPELAGDVGTDAPGGPVPPENQPGHHPAEEQDKPPLDKFAAKLGTMEPAQRKEVLADEPRAASTPAPAPATRRNALAGVAAAVALFGIVAAVIAGRRRRSRR